MSTQRTPSRRAAWGTTAMAAGLFLLWVASMLSVVRIPAPNGTVRFCHGAIDYFNPATAPPGFSITPGIAMPPVLVPRWGTLRGGPFVVFPLWIPAALLGWIAYRKLRRLYDVPPGHCHGCRYDLRGNATGRCPECGMAVQSADAEAR